MKRTLFCLLTITMSCNIESDDSEKLYFDDGSLHQECQLVNKKREGECVSYYPSGSVRYRGNFQNGIEHGPYSFFFENGNIKERSQYRSGLKHGKLETFYESGITKSKMHYVAGKRNGMFSFFDSTGLLTSKVEYSAVLDQDAPHVNQHWYFDQMGNIDTVGSRFYHIDRIHDDQSVRFSLFTDMFESMFVVLGEFDSAYNILDSNSIDTIFTEGLSCTHIVTGDQLVNGRLNGYFFNYNIDTIVTDSGMLIEKLQYKLYFNSAI